MEKYKNLWERWADNTRRFPDKDAIVHWKAGEEPFRWSFKNLFDTANKFSVLLQKQGIKRDQVCAIIIRHNPMFFPLYLGIAGLGAIPAVLAYPNPRLHPDKFKSGVEGMSQRSGLDWIFTERDLEPIISPLVTKEGSTIKGLHFPLEWDREFTLSREDSALLDSIRGSIVETDPVLLQHSSGTTGLQKPVLLSQRAVSDHVDNYAESINLTKEDKIVSWLPLYHDMGLIAAYHVPLAYGITSIQVDPFEWVLAPSLQFEALNAEKATICWLPNFAYNFMADRIEEDEMEDISLKSLRLVINCSEPVRNESHKKFVAAFQKYGFNPLALSASYAMAETTFAATQTTPGEPIFTLEVDRESLAQGKVVPPVPGKASRVCVSSGKVIKGCVVRIVDETGKELPENGVGEIIIQSVSMFDGYRNYPEKTAEVLKDGWYYSGDYGFKLNGELFVIGRKKDIIIVAGKNIYPEDVEDAVGAVEGILPGRVIAFGEEDPELGTEEISVVAETPYEDETEKKQLIQRVRMKGTSVDMTITNVYLVPPRWLIKSSAGKPSRKANKERIAEMKDLNKQ
ncbi:MAG: AMP-binding protein [Ignavibacteriales bacterium]|nr:MAG: fatty acyl-AMP ligase [Ignavibacteriaceae bacterium]MBW7871960.1 AMP-binding protein [Ignavibacteria bacterium]MCZ2144382.1 AMP-binding protein [Ignavibacteriales bacterium]MBV6446143.1 2-succinylbenzoate--CoA ligase [Ignavibacteriaceae bacterium]MBZ0197425.1 AMP-binding protein [Ignavibacteriaceae bacterium]